MNMFILNIYLEDFKKWNKCCREVVRYVENWEGIGFKITENLVR